MQGSHPLICPLFIFLYSSLHVSGTRLLLAGCGCHKCQACMERCNLSSRHGRPVKPTVLLHTAGESWAQQRRPYYDSKTNSKATKMITRLIFALFSPPLLCC